MTTKRYPAWRRRIGYRLRCWADRIDWRGAPRLLGGHTFTFETGVGMVFRTDGRGCQLAYIGDTEYDKAHSESDSEKRERQQREALNQVLADLDIDARFGHTAVETTHTEDRE